MNSRERVRMAFNHEEADRVPIDYLANPGIDARMKKHFGLDAKDAEGLRLALGVDFRSVMPRYSGPELHPGIEDRIVSIWGAHTRWIEHASGGYWDYCDFPLKGATEEEVGSFPMPSPDDFDYDGALALCERYRDYCLVLGDAGQADCINSTGMVRTMEETLVDMALGEGAGLAYMRRKNVIQLAVLERMLDKAKGRIDILFLGEDLGTQIGPMISLEMYRAVLKPIHKSFVDLAKSFGAKVMIHSCGSSSWVYEDFIEMGVDIVDTLQPEAANMAPAYLKSKFGSRLCLHGCISTAGPVERGSVADVERDVAEKLAVLMPGGGYAFSPTHELQDDSPTENVVRMYELAKTVGRYRK
jgi:uroporphyrinogen decarboxylase